MPGSSRKTLKVVLGLSCVLLLMWLLTLSRFGSAKKNDSPGFVSDKQMVDTLATTKSAKDPSVPTISNGGSSDMFANGVVIFVLLMAILILVWFWAGGKQATGSGHFQREIGSQVLGEGAQIKIITINDEVWVLGVTSESVNLLHRYSKGEWVEPKVETENDINSFAKLLKSKL